MRCVTNQHTNKINLYWPGFVQFSNCQVHVITIVQLSGSYHNKVYSTLLQNKMECFANLIKSSRPERWSIFQGNRMGMVVFLQQWNGDGLWKFSPLPSMVQSGINHRQRWFFQYFFSSILRTNSSKWLQTEICHELRLNDDVKNKNASYQFISLKCSTLLGNFTCFSLGIVLWALFCLISVSASHKGKTYLTIAINGF